MVCGFSVSLLLCSRVFSLLVLYRCVSVGMFLMLLKLSVLCSRFSGGWFGSVFVVGLVLLLLVRLLLIVVGRG